jgi:hypothetical protein
MKAKPRTEKQKELRKTIEKERRNSDPSYRERVRENNKRSHIKHLAERKEHSKQYYRDNKEKYKIWHKEHREQARLDIIANYGGKCACCGETEPLFLEIDHVNGGGSTDRKNGLSGTMMYLKLKEQGYPKDDYQLLCANCNHGKFRNGGVCPHYNRL